MKLRDLLEKGIAELAKHAEASEELSGETPGRLKL
jgi:hypothetical protein